MNPGSESRSAGRGEAVANPLLMECDTHGRVLWMNEGARAAFGHAHSLAAAMRSVAPSGPAALLRLASVARFSPIFQRGDSIWISAELAGPAEIAVRQEAHALLKVQCDLLGHYFRLQHVERELSYRTRQMRRGGGARAVILVERERQRLGRDLHTGVGGTLAAIRLQLEIVAAQLAEPSVPVQQALSRISTLAGEALEYVRSVSQRLHPPQWQRLTLETALRQLWEVSGIPQRFEASLLIEPLPQEPPLELKVLMYRAAQEALSNLTRHSRATRAGMTLRLSGGRLILTCEDNGIGFDAKALFSAPASLASGLGLRSIREQAASLGGELIVESGPNGTKLEVSAPFYQEQPS